MRGLFWIIKMRLFSCVRLLGLGNIAKIRVRLVPFINLNAIGWICIYYLLSHIRSHKLSKNSMYHQYCIHVLENQLELCLLLSMNPFFFEEIGNLGNVALFQKLGKDQILSLFWFSFESSISLQFEFCAGLNWDWKEDVLLLRGRVSKSPIKDMSTWLYMPFWGM